MSVRSIWKGSLGFGMVAIPVKLYGAVEEKRISLNQLHKECGSRVQMPKYCPTCEKQVGNGEIIKGYPLDKEHYIQLTEEEMDSLPLKSLKSIQVEAFLKGDVEDPRYYSGKGTNCYVVSPEEVGAKAFVLFTSAMQELGVTGIAKLAVRERESLCSVIPFNGVLLLRTIHWADELRDYGEVIPFASVSDKELEMAKQLIGALTGEIDLANYKDAYRDALLALIQAKLEGKTIEVPTVEKKQDMDLVDALEASLRAMTAEPA